MLHCECPCKWMNTGANGLYSHLFTLIYYLMIIHIQLLYLGWWKPTSKICAKCVSLLENMAWMQWMAYLAWRGGPFLALCCSTGIRTLGDRRGAQGKRNLVRKALGHQQQLMHVSCLRWLICSLIHRSRSTPSEPHLSDNVNGSQSGWLPRAQTHDLICGKLSSSLPPVFLKICRAASATFSSSIFKQLSKDSKVSAEWKDTGWVKDRTWG